MSRNSEHRFKASIVGLAMSAVTACGPAIVTTSPPVITAPPPPTLDLTIPPLLGPPPTLLVPPIVTRVLPNGLRIVVVEHHELPLADILLEVRTGGEADPASKPGTASLVASLLPEGTSTRNALQIGDQQALLGISLNANSGWEQSTVAIHTPTAQIDSALGLLADVILNPAFSSADLDRVRKARLTALQQQRDRGPSIADRAFATAVFGANNPYGRPLAGTEASLASLTRDELTRFYSTFFRPNNSILLVVGDVHPDEIERRARMLFGAWANGDVPVVATNTVSAPKGTTVIIVDKAGAAQSSVRIGGIGAPRSTKDYFALQVMNTLLGGSFGSRLNQNLRETHAFTYGASSNFSYRRSPGPYTAAAEIVSAKTDSALIQFIKELRAIRDTVPAAELERTKRYLQLGLPQRFETTGGIAGQLLQLLTYDIPLDFYNTAVQNIGAVTQSDVQRVAREYIDPTRLTLVVVGDRKSIEPGIRALGLGEVVIHDVRDVLGEPPTPR